MPPTHSAPGFLRRATQKSPAIAALIFLLQVGGNAVLPAADEVPAALGRIGVQYAFSKSMFQDVNANDAKAAMKVYALGIGNENQIDMSSAPLYLDGTNAIIQALRLKQFDIISLSALEYLSLENQGLGGPFLVSKVNQTITEQYVLLARVDSPLRQVGDLPGHTVIIASDLRALLAPLWLEVLCRQNGLGPARRVFATTKFSEKPNEVVLPVFFGKTDTCITTRKSWDVMGELNPQLKQQLRVIAASPAVIPGMSCFREDLSLAFKERMLAVTQRSRTMPSFKQMMALFKCDEVCPEPVSVLEGTRQLVAAYHQLCEGTNQTSPASARSAP